MPATSVSVEPARLVKVLNNNVVLARDGSGRELILVGRGLGYGSGARHMRPDDPRVEKVFVLAGEGRAFLRLLREDERLTGTCAEILGLATRRLGADLSGSVFAALPEHLAAALQRARLGLEIPNPFLSEIQTLYPEEYQVAGEALEVVAERLGVRLPDSEQGFLALHLAAGRSGRTPKAVTRHVAIVQEVLERIRAAVLPPLAPGREEASGVDAALRRLTIHLHHALELARQGVESPNPLLAQIQDRYPEVYRLARALADLMADRLGSSIPDGEAGYLALHILRLEVLAGAGG